MRALPGSEAIQRGVQISDAQARQSREYHCQRRRDVQKAQPE